jgi:hypothetical protein
VVDEEAKSVAPDAAKAEKPDSIHWFRHPCVGHSRG